MSVGGSMIPIAPVIGCKMKGTLSAFFGLAKSLFSLHSLNVKLRKSALSWHQQWGEEEGIASAVQTGFNAQFVRRVTDAILSQGRCMLKFVGYV